MNEGLPGESMPDPPTAEQPLVPELEGYRADFRWAKGEIHLQRAPLGESLVGRGMRRAPVGYGP